MKIRHLLFKISLLVCILYICSAILGTYGLNTQCWSPTELVSPDSTNDAYRAILDIDNNDTIHIAWRDKTNYNNSGDDFDIFYKQHLVNNTWTPTELVSSESDKQSTCFFLTVTEDGIAHVVWKEETHRYQSGDGWDIVYKRRLANGSWTKVEIVSIESKGNCSCPVAKVDNTGIVHVIWSDGTDYMNAGDDYDLFYKQRLTNGTWTKAEVITKESTHHCNSPSLSIDSTNTVHVVWEEVGSSYGTGDDYDIFYKKRVGSDLWTTPEIISKESTRNSVIPSMVIDQQDTIHVAWVDQTDYMASGGDYDVFYKQMRKNSTWSVTELVSTESKQDCNWPCIDDDPLGNVYVVWKDATNYEDSGQDTDIFYKERFINGTWTPAELVSAESNYDSHWPWIVVDSERLAHISWWDNYQNTQWKVFYKSRLCQDAPISTNNDITKDSKDIKIPELQGILILLIVIPIIYMIKKKYRRL
jgi:hypothetical protein